MLCRNVTRCQRAQCPRPPASGVHSTSCLPHRRGTARASTTLRRARSALPFCDDTTCRLSVGAALHLSWTRLLSSSRLTAPWQPSSMLRPPPAARPQPLSGCESCCLTTCVPSAAPRVCGLPFREAADDAAARQLCRSAHAVACASAACLRHHTPTGCLYRLGVPCARRWACTSPPQPQQLSAPPAWAPCST